jgi:hypothetical protein
MRDWKVLPIEVLRLLRRFAPRNGGTEVMVSRARLVTYPVVAIVDVR